MLLGCHKAAPAEIRSGTIAITATEDGFSPNKIRLAKGQPATLSFTRTAAHTCAERVKIPALNVDVPLPLGTPVTVPVPTDAAKTLTFTCGMDMFTSTVTIE
jgi:plastocyanin domain-containing protein